MASHLLERCPAVSSLAVVDGGWGVGREDEVGFDGGGGGGGGAGAVGLDLPVLLVFHMFRCGAVVGGWRSEDWWRASEVTSRDGKGWR